MNDRRENEINNENELKTKDESESKTQKEGKARAQRPPPAQEPRSQSTVGLPTASFPLTHPDGVLTRLLPSLEATEVTSGSAVRSLS